MVWSRCQMFDSISLEEHLKLFRFKLWPIGTPYLANKLCSLSMVLVEVVVSIFSISNHLEWASTTIKNMQPRKGLAKSVWICCQGNDGHSHGCTGAVLGSACRWPKTPQETSFNSQGHTDGWKSVLLWMITFRAGSTAGPMKKPLYVPQHTRCNCWSAKLV